MRDQILRLLRPVDTDSSLWPLAQRYAWTIPVVAGLGFVASLLEGFGISLLIPLLGTLLSTGVPNLPGPLAALSRLAAQFDPNTRLLLIGGTIFSFVALKSVVQVANASFIAWVDGLAGHEIRSALSRQIQTVGYPFFLQQDASRLLNIISTEAWRASEAIKTGFTLVANIAASVVFALLLLAVSWRLTLVVGVGVLAIRAAQAHFLRRAERMSVAVTDSNFRLGEQMVRSIHAMRLIRIFGQESGEQAEFERVSTRVRRSMLAVERLNAAVASGIEVAYAALFIGALIGGYMTGVPAPVLVAFLVLLYRSQPFLRSISQARMAIAATAGSVQEVEWLLDPKGKPAAPAGSVPFHALGGPIVFDQVSFAYGGERSDAPALRNASFTIQKGRTTALIGRSGSGKSTIVNLLCRLMEPTSGRILVAGVDLSSLDPASWRGRIGIAGQDADLLDATIAENICYGKAEATQDEIAEAARLAGLDGLIAELPQGYETPVGLAGLRLSGGQRQRIGLARAFLRKPDILILDEATNAVDGLSEAVILSLLKARSWETTTVVVSHRASTLASCEDCVVLEDGVVVGSGPLSQRENYERMMGMVAS